MATSIIDATTHTPKVLVQGFLASTETTQYTVPASTWVTLKSCTICNTSVSVVGVSISLVKSGNTAGASSRVLALTLSAPATSGVAAGDSFEVTELSNHVMGPGDFISTLASTASVISFVLSGVVSA
jgi:hypothetical protein